MASLAALAIFFTLATVWFFGIPYAIGRAFKADYDTIGYLVCLWMLPGIIIMLAFIGKLEAMYS